MFYLFLLLVGVASLGVYVLFILNVVPGAKEERLGVLEPLPPDWGTWKPDAESEEGRAAAERGELREVRHFYYETNGRLVLQTRYRDLATNEIVRVGPEQTVKRKRVRA